MPIEMLMPALSPTMTEGNLAKWHKKEGDAVKAGDVLAEIETDKATMEMEAVDEGTLGRILVPEGAQGVKVNQPIALMLGEGEDAGGARREACAGAASRAAPPAPAAAAPRRSRSPTPRRRPAAAAGCSGSHAPATPATATPPTARIFASPLARRMAEQAGLDLAALTGSGPHGRIVKADIEARARRRGRRRAAPARAGGGADRAAAPRRSRPPACRKAQVVALAGNPPYTEMPISAMRRVIARRLTESKQTVPHFYLTIDCEIDRLLAMRAEANAADGRQTLGQRFRHQGGGAGAAPGAGGQRVVERRCDPAVGQRSTSRSRWRSMTADHADHQEAPTRRGWRQISAEMKDLAARARAGKLKLEEFQGGTFSISNLGMFGIKDFAAVINPPQGCILAVGAGEQRAGGEERRARHRHGDELHARLRSPRASTARVGARLHAGLQEDRSKQPALLCCCEDGERWLKRPYDLDRRRRRAGRLCRGDPRGAARHEDRGRRARAARRHLPQLGLHPDQGAAAHVGDQSPAASSRPVRLLGQGHQLRPQEDRRALAQGGEAAVRRRQATCCARTRSTWSTAHGQARRQGQARGRRRTASRSPISPPSTSSSPPARARARCPGSSPTASWSGPTRRR